MEILKKPIVKDVITNITYLLLVTLYFVCFNTQLLLIDSTLIIRYIDISSIVFLGISIIMFEIAYAKGKKHLMVSGIELILLAVHTLLIERSQVSIISTSYVWPIYYCLKAVIIYTQENRKKLKQISDIAEIVKEEKPTKKVAKKRKK